MPSIPNRIFVDYEITPLGLKTGPAGATGNARFAAHAPTEAPALPADAAGGAFGRGHPLAFALVRDGECVLDLGCGASIDVVLAADRVGPTGLVIGIDDSEAMLESTRKSVASAGYRNVDLRHGRVEALPVEDQSVDWVISNDVINLTPHKDKAFAEIFRVLKPGGRLIVSDIVADQLPPWVRRSAALTSARVAGAVSETSYLAGLARAGFSSYEVVNRLYFGPSQLGAMVRSSLPKPLAGSFVGRLAADVTKGLTTSISGKFWSACIHARKPALNLRTFKLAKRV